MNENENNELSELLKQQEEILKSFEILFSQIRERFGITKKEEIELGLQEENSIEKAKENK